MKKNLLYLLMLLAMPMAFVACGDDDDDNDVKPTTVNATGTYDGDIVLLVDGENLFEAAVGSTSSSSPIEFSLNQKANSTDLAIDDELLYIGNIALSIENIASTATSEKLTLNGTNINVEKNIIGLDVTINSVTGTIDKNGKATLNISAVAPALSQNVEIEITAQKK